MSYDEVGKMTPDQVYHCLCNRDVLKTKGGKRVAKTSALHVAPSADGSGMIKGRSADGTPIAAKVRVGGKSLARRMMEAEQAKREAEQQTGRRGRRRR